MASTVLSVSITDVFQFVTPPSFTLRFSESMASLSSPGSSDSETEEIPYTKSPLDDCRGCVATVRKTERTVRGFRNVASHKKSRTAGLAATHPNKR
jgi:hypothetical protein